MGPASHSPEVAEGIQSAEDSSILVAVAAVAVAADWADRSHPDTVRSATTSLGWSQESCNERRSNAFYTPLRSNQVVASRCKFGELSVDLTPKRNALQEICTNNRDQSQIMSNTIGIGAILSMALTSDAADHFWTHNLFYER